MKTWICSDLHINHKNILQYCPHRLPVGFTGELPEDVTDLVNEMNAQIIANHNSVVGPDDEVYFLGDICMGKISEAPTYIRQLNGKKYLVKGNHDKSLHKLIKNNPDLMDMFFWIRDVHEMSYKFGDKKVNLFMSHFPHYAWNGMNTGTIHTHGHLHGSPCSVTGRIMDVGIDTNNLFPYNMDDVVEKMLKIDAIRNHH